MCFSTINVILARHWNSRCADQFASDPRTIFASAEADDG